jgi:hypothetical protein
MNKLLLGIDLIKRMGIKPIAYRAIHTFKKKTGLLKRSFPTQPSNRNFVSLREWKKSPTKFFFSSKGDLKPYKLSEDEYQKLANNFLRVKEGYIQFFNGEWRYLGENYKWTTNPATNYTYDLKKHWTELETLDPGIGDIKYVWEKSRFSYLYTLIRYDFHFYEDQSEFVFSQILSWIEKNPLNSGPNFSCSQEISIRVLNWIFALYYYKNSPALTDDRFHKIINSIYDQAHHVEEHLNFSLLTVRNNHAITECLLLYSVGLLFPFFTESNRWKKKGKRLLEQEGLYQIYPDGSYLQFSTNYERVVIQLYTWAFYLAKANDDPFSSHLTDRINKALNFLYQLQDPASGFLPNYGANDGALFFPLNQCEFRDYRPQLNALNYIINGKSLYKEQDVQEDIFWFCTQKNTSAEIKLRETSSFSTGGYYVLRDSEKFSFIRCGNHPDRPSQADNLHLDIWYKGENILRDAGSFKYNTSKEETKFFMGTASHNTIMIEEYDQMYKGGRFLWFYWSGVHSIPKIIDTEEAIIFEGSIRAFKHVSKNIIHKRIVKQFKKEARWEITDVIEGTDKIKKQIWNPYPAFFELGFKIYAKDELNNQIEPLNQNGFYSHTYGIKEPSKQILFITNSNTIQTTIFKK